MRINALEREIPDWSERSRRAAGDPGCGALTAAKIVGETAGVAQVPLQGLLTPGSPAPHRCRSGPATQPGHAAQPRRQPATQPALHRIAITQGRGIGPGRDLP